MADLQLAQQVLTSRGVPHTPENVQRILAVLEQNPELAQRFAQQQAIREGGRNEPSAQSPVISAFADPFDAAFEKAVVGEPQPQPTQTQPTPTQTPTAIPGQEVTQPAPTAVGPPPVPSSVAPSGQGIMAPEELDVIAQVVAQAGVQGNGGNDFPIIPIAPAPAGRPVGTEVVPAASRGVVAQGATSAVGAQGALPGPQAQKRLTGPQGALPPPPAVSDGRTINAQDISDSVKDAKRRGFHGPGVRKSLGGNIVPNDIMTTPQSISDIIDAQDAPIKQVSSDRIEFDMGRDHVVMDKKNGVVAIASPDGALAQVRSPAILERIRSFLQQFGDEFKIFARLL